MVVVLQKRKLPSQQVSGPTLTKCFWLLNLTSIDTEQRIKTENLTIKKY